MEVKVLNNQMIIQGTSLVAVFVGYSCELYQYFIASLAFGLEKIVFVVSFLILLMVFFLSIFLLKL